MTTGTVVVRPCTDADLGNLEKWAPTTDVDLPQRWLERQGAGEITYLLALVDDRIVASAKVRWFEPRQPAHRPVPELFQLGVWPSDMRGVGVGSALIAEAEQLARDRGVASIAMGVDLDNVHAMRLYERRGYRDWGHGEREDAYRGSMRAARSSCSVYIITYMVKEL